MEDTEHQAPWPFPPDDMVVGARVNGQIQRFNIETRDWTVAYHTVKDNVEGAKPILVRIK
jgi:environmental stress-induced protein Ves